MLRQEHRGLSGGVCAANYDHLVVTAQLGLDRGGRIVDAAALELRQIRELKLAVLGAGGNHDGARVDQRPIVDLYRVQLPIAAERSRAAGNNQLCAEPLCLGDRPAGEFETGNAGREPEVVLDSRARAGLTSK